jgi:cysteine desulfurase/selenocysteine lyase
MPPLLGGGHMIARVGDFESTWAEPPAKFEAGTMPVAEAIGLGAAVEWLGRIGMDAVWEHSRGRRRLRARRACRACRASRSTARATSRSTAPPCSFALDGIHPHDVAEILGRDGVCVRAGHHCAQPLMRRLGVGATSRASFAIHSTREDVDRLIEGLGPVREVFA